MQNLIILETKAKHLGKVVERAEHALRGRLKLAKPGDLLLLAEKQPRGAALVRYGMWLETQKPATPEEIAELWGQENKHIWKWRIIGKDCQQLPITFIPENERIHSPREYARGGGCVYVHRDDAELFRRKGFLAPFF
jgi:hypothetical protein